MKHKRRTTNLLAVALLLLMALLLLAMPQVTGVSLAWPDPGVTPVDRVTPNWLLYDDLDYGFVIRYPPDWFLYPTKRSEGGDVATISNYPINEIVDKSITRRQAGFAKVEVGVFLHDKLPTQSLEEWVQPAEWMLPPLVQQNDLVVNGIRTVQQIYRRGETLVQTAYIPRGTKVYFVTMTALDSTLPPEMPAILQSFAFTIPYDRSQEIVEHLYPQDSYEPPGGISLMAPGGFRLPCDGSYAISNGPGEGLHAGNAGEAIDLVVPAGTPVKATEVGNVTFASWDGSGYGWSIMLHHDNGMDSWYAHLQTIQVSLNQRPSKGQQIALSGKSGCGDCGAHLHFHVKSGSNPVCIRDLSDIWWNTWFPPGNPDLYSGCACYPPCGSPPGQCYEGARKLSCDGPTPPNLNFTAELYGAPSNNQSAGVVIEVCGVGSTTPLFKQTATTGSNGQYYGLTLSGISPGVYDLYAKPIAPSGYLRRKAGYVTLSSGTNTVDFSRGGTAKFIPGDIDVYGQDNEINVLDFSVFVHRYRYAPNDPLADFNRDGEVNILDYSIFVKGFGESGDGKIGGNQSGSQIATEQNSTLNAYVVLLPVGGVARFVGDIAYADIIVDTGDYATDGTDVIVSYDPSILEVQDENPAKEGIQVKEGTSQGMMYSSYPTNYVDTTLGKIYLRGTTDTGASPVQTRWGDFGSIRFRTLCGIEATNVSIEFTPQFSVDTNVAANVNHRDVLVAVQGVDYEINGSPRCDATPPTGHITSPNAGSATNTCPIIIHAEASDDQSGVNRVEFHVWYDGNWHHIGDDHISPYSIDWDCSSVGDQAVWFTIHVWDNEGNEAINPGGYIYVTLDRVKPTGQITSPTTDSYINSDQVDIIAAASDDRSGVAGLEFFVWYDDGSGYDWHGLPWDWDGYDGWTSVWETSDVEDQESIWFWIYIFDYAGNIGNYSHGGITLDRVPPCVLSGDFTCDCDVDVQDIQEVASRWRCKCEDLCYDSLYDLDGDCDIDIVDIMLVVVHWGDTCELLATTVYPLGVKIEKPT